MLGAGAGAGAAAHHHHDREKDNLGSDTNRSFPLGGQSSTTSGSAYPAGPTSTAAGTTSGPHSSSLANKADPRFDSDRDRSDLVGKNAGYPSGSTSIAAGTTSGPHSSSLANKVDPRVDSDRDGSTLTGKPTGYGSSSIGYGSGTGPTTGAAHQGTLEREGGLGGSTGVGSGVAGYGPESWKHDHGTHGHTYEGDPCVHGAAVPGPHFTTGPHATDTANRLDPHVASGIGEPSATIHKDSGSELGSTSHAGDHHHGRDAALAGGAGAAGIGAYESSRGPSGSATESTTSTGPHKSSLLNKLDPHARSDLKQDDSVDTTGSSGTAGSSGLNKSSTTGVSDLPSSQATTRDHHHGRDAGFVGAGGVAGYEAEKHLRDPKHTDTASTGISDPYSSSSIDPRVDSKSSSGLTGSTDPTRSSKDHHYRRDAGLAGTGGVAAYEAEKHLGKGASSNNSSRLPESTGATAYDSSRGPTGTGTDSLTGKDHHYGRDAGIAGIGAGGVAAYEAEKHHDRSEPRTATGSSADPSTGYGDRDQSSGSHTGRDSAVIGGAGAGVGAASGAEFSKKEAEKLERQQHKEIEKEQKSFHKDQAKHEKVLEKEEKKHEKALAKEEKKHDDGKKHGGILGLFHRDKPDKDLKEEELERRGAGSHHGVETAAGVGAAGTLGAAAADHEKHERNRLHKDPPEGYGQSTNYADPPEGGYASQVTGGTGTTALAQGQEVSEGSHLTSLGNKVDPK